MDDLGRPDLFKQFLDHRLAGEAELVNAPIDRGGPEFEPQPIVEEFLNLEARQAKAQRQRCDEGAEHRADQTALGRDQVAFAALDARTRATPGRSALS